MHPRSRRARWGGVAALALALASLGLGGSARAQTATSPSEQFGGFTAAARANGVQFTYNVENVFPLPAPLFQASMPEASTSMQSGPSATALGSVAYPGNVIANLPAVIAQAQPDAATFFPNYPLQTKAEYPAGPTTNGQDVATSTSRVRAEETFAEAVTTMGGGDLPAFARMGAITTSARTAILEEGIETRSRIEVGGIDLLFGLLHIDAVTTDLVATSDGETAASAGGTHVVGATFLGLPVTIGPDGVVFDTPTPPENPGPLTPLVDGIGDLTGTSEQLASAVAPLNQALQDVLGTTNATLEELLSASGISIRTMAPFEVLDGPAAERTANGLVIDINYDGSGDNPLAQLLAAIPSEQLPAEGIPGFPLNTSPQALVNLMKETHVVGVAIAYGNVNVNASPAFSFEADLGGLTGGLGSLGGLGGSVGTTSFPSSNFTTPAPQLPGPAGTALGADGAAAGLTAGGAAAAIVLALLSAPLWAVGSRSLADNVLGMAGSSCPDGLDQPLKGG